MSRFSNTIEIVIKHWPHKTDDNDPMVRKVADICSLAGAEEQDIAEFCEMLSDFSDLAFQRGIDAVRAGE
jgi:hypothetical protein